jgi:hypothetical protein
MNFFPPFFPIYHELWKLLKDISRKWRNLILDLCDQTIYISMFIKISKNVCLSYLTEKQISAESR